MSQEIELTPSERVELCKTNVTYGGNPRKEQVRRLKQAVKHIQDASELFARMGVVYTEFGNEEHSDYCACIFASLSSIEEASKNFLENM